MAKASPSPLITSISGPLSGVSFRAAPSSILVCSRHRPRPAPTPAQEAWRDELHRLQALYKSASDPIKLSWLSFTRARASSSQAAKITQADAKRAFLRFHTWFSQIAPGVIFAAPYKPQYPTPITLSLTAVAPSSLYITPVMAGGGTPACLRAWFTKPSPFPITSRPHTTWLAGSRAGAAVLQNWWPLAAPALKGLLPGYHLGVIVECADTSSMPSGEVWASCQIS